MNRLRLIAVSFFVYCFLRLGNRIYRFVRTRSTKLSLNVLIKMSVYQGFPWLKLKPKQSLGLILTVCVCLVLKKLSIKLKIRNIANFHQIARAACSEPSLSTKRRVSSRQNQQYALRLIYFTFLFSVPLFFTLKNFQSRLPFLSIQSHL
jgi:hypothetical protein